MSSGDRVIVIGAGMVGSAIAYFCALHGLNVTVVERGVPASGTSSRCEGNILLSDKRPGPELDLARFSLDVWTSDWAEFSSEMELERKGGLIVASTPDGAAGLESLVRAQRATGVEATLLTRDEALRKEPHLNPELLTAAHYPQDCQVQPMLAVNHLLKRARDLGARVMCQTEVTEILRQGDRVTGVMTTAGKVEGHHVVNAAGVWGSAVARLARVDIPVLPRRGFVLVTEALPPMIRHKVYAAEYVDNVGSSDAALQTSAVVEGTPGGTILLGSSRERVGFEQGTNPLAVQRIAHNAATLFPFLLNVRVIRMYHGFRPYCPDHVPVIGADPRLEGLWHACGHEGAGIGLAPGTGKLLAQAIAGVAPQLSLQAFSPARFDPYSHLPSPEAPVG